MTLNTPSNGAIAEILREIADLLQAKGENIYRVNSYRNAARAVETTSVSIASTAKKEGIDGIRRVKGVGEKIGGLILEFVQNGTVALKDSLSKEVPEDKVKALEGKRSGLPSAASMFVPTTIILEVDKQYRERAKAGILKKIAPRLQNPEKKQWLPVMTTTSHGLKFTVMFSNTATAHELGKTDDWVVVYYSGADGEGQCTVVTEQKGKRKGERVVRGREDE